MSRPILLVDDNEMNLKLAQTILAKAGYQVTVAASGQAALDLASRQTPALVLLDIRLPDIDGLEVLRRLREFSEMRGVPIVAMTAQALPDEVERFMAAGCDGYIQKPISIESFRAEVRRHMDRTSEQEQHR
jgi:two-component system, cell cycle response regulator DivK